MHADKPSKTHRPDLLSGKSILAIAVGNTRTRVGLFKGKELSDPVSLPNTSAAAIVEACAHASKSGIGAPVVVMSSVNKPFADSLAPLLEREEKLGELFRFGKDAPIPIAHALDDASTVGQDRLLCALGAFSRAEQACVIVDAGTAITVDFVDGEGTFQGGVIAPGLAMMVRALHDHTAGIDAFAFEFPDAARGVFGKDTKHAVVLGAVCAARGLVRHTVEQYAQVLGAYPQIVATGGDAPALFEHDDLVEHVVPDLQLIGIFEACAIIAGRSENPDGDDPDGNR